MSFNTQFTISPTAFSVRILNREEIDDKKWDRCVGSAFNETPMAYCWVLDYIAPGWHGAIIDDYTGVMPLTAAPRAGASILQMPPETQYLGLLSANPDIVSLFPSILGQNYFTKFRFIAQSCVPNDQSIEMPAFGKWRTTCELNLSSEYESLFSQYTPSHKKNIRRFGRHNFFIEQNLKPEAYTSLKQEFAKTRPEVYVPSAHYQRFNNLIKTSIQNGSGTILTIDENDKTIGAVYFLCGKRRCILFHSADETGRHKKTTFGLIDKYIQLKAGKNLILDFAGSDIASICEFNIGFGAQKKQYMSVTIDNLPWHLRLAKKIRLKYRMSRLVSKVTNRT